MSAPDERTGLAATALAPCWERVADKLTGAFGRTVSLVDMVVRPCTPEELAEALPFAVVGCLHRADGGITGDGLVGLSEEQARAVADLMMGGDGVNFGDEFGDLQVSAVAEALNQMADALAQGLGSAVGNPVSIVCEEAATGVLGEQLDGLRRMAGESPLDLVTARVDVDGALSLSFYHILQSTFVDQLTGGASAAGEAVAASSAPGGMPEPAPAEASDALMSQDEVAALLGRTGGAAAEEEASPLSARATATDSLAASAAMSQDEIASLLAGISTPAPPSPAPSAVTATEARPARFEPLGAPPSVSGESGYELILDIPVQVSVELGRATMRVRDILGLGSGAIVELDKASGEPVDVLAGGRRIATGEVVVVDENFGVRILQILRVSPDSGTSTDSSR
ncbi:MAG TPA: flagellar motor switch protein FliN [Armatimonadota bacterium]|nr:flagellar motor switch protein FliN [Armatimonadota bacterium]HQK94158.1 flagellar motor switch protein FliN [Armatimonadota bacterium]